MRRSLTSTLAGLALLLGSSAMATAADPNPADWNAVLAAAKGETVYFNAWGGEPRINAYIAWAGEEVSKRYGVTVNLVKLDDTGAAVSKVLAEKSAGKLDGGSVDLIWINGKNFAAMKEAGLLFGPFAEALPSFAGTDADHHPAVRSDFTVATDGKEVPWGQAQVVFMYDTAALPLPPKSMEGLLSWTKANQGRFTYPLPPDFLGSTFLKQALIEISADKPALYKPVDQADFAKVTAPLWAYLDQLHPNLWRSGKTFPANSSDLRKLFADGETKIAFAFNPAEASAAIANKELPDTVRTYVLDGGTIGNVHFLAIPFNSANKAAAMVLANFMLSPEAQARKLDPAIWGDWTVLATGTLPAADKALFDAVPHGVATLSPAELGAAVPEPHPSWMAAIEKEWAKRYSGN